MNILLTGAAGQLGSELLPILSARGRLTATDRSTPVSVTPASLTPASVTPGPVTANWTELDISNGGKLEDLLNSLRPTLIVNTAAYTAVDQAEADSVTAFDVNTELPGRLARWAKLNAAGLIHYSTDYVFNGNATRPYLETDQPDPKNTYGDSKLAGERAIEVTGCQHVILRTSWVYSSHGKNFVLSMLDLARRGLSLRVVDDQLGCPTWAKNLALATDAVIERWQSPGVDCPNGVYHYCDDRIVNWYEFAREIFTKAVSAGLLESHPDLTAVPDSEFPQTAPRPKWSVLDTSRIDTVYNIRPASFNQSLQAVIDEISIKRVT